MSSQGGDPAIKAVQENRILDNTLPLAAFDYFKHLTKLGHELSDPYAKGCFQDFVNAFINTPKTHAGVVLPHGPFKFEEADRFTFSWHDGARHTPKLPQPRFDAPKNVTATFLDDAVRRPGKWAGLIQLTWQREIVNRFKGRAPKWRLESEETLDLLLPALALNRERYGHLKVSIRKALRHLDPIDEEFEAHAIARRVPLEVYALAYALSWFIRGGEYCRLAQNRALKCHPLRALALDIGVQPTQELTGADEVNWSLLLEDALKKRTLRCDADLFLDLLEQLRDVNLHDKEFQWWLKKCRESRGKDAEHFRRWAHILAAERAAIALELRDETMRKRVIHALQESAIAFSRVKLMGIESFVCLVLTFAEKAVDSKAVRRGEVRLRSKVEKLGWRQNIWRTFKRPGSY